MRHKRPKEAHRYAGRLAVVIFLPLLAVFMVMQSLWPDTAIRLFGFKTYLVSDTGSMEPLLRHRDFIVVRRGSMETVRAGDMVTFWSTVTVDGTSRRAPVTHRVVETLTDDKTGAPLCRTAGINPATNPEPDLRPVSADGAPGTNRYIGTYAFKIPVAGHAIAFFRSPFGLVAAGFNLLVFLAVHHIRRRGEAAPSADAS